MRLLPLFLILISSLTWAADPVLLPADVQAVLTDYDAKIAKAKADVVVKLQKAQEAATKKGNLDLAMTLKAKVAEFSGTEEPTKPKAKQPATYRDETGGKYVVLYNETDYGGLKVKVPVPTDTTEVTALNFPNDALRSIQIPAGVTVRLYDGDMGGGSETDLTESTADLTPLTHIGTTSLSAKKTAK